MNDESLKARIRNISKEKNISAQAMLQNYLMSRFLYRLSLTNYKDKFVIKGGMLISSIIGVEHRTTMDLDITIKDLPLTKDKIKQAFIKISNVKIDDEIEYLFDSLSQIREDDEYGGYRILFFAKFGKIKAPMSIDVSTGDVITPGAEKHIFKDMFNKDTQFELWSYPIETVLAEKVETILSRGIDNSRPRDFYDVYMLSGIDYDKALFNKAFESTSIHRGSKDKIANYKDIIKEIAQNKTMNERWNNYSQLMPYAKNIDFKETLDTITRLLK